MALVATPTNTLAQRGNKENGPHQLETPSSIDTNASRQRVAFSDRNREHFFDPGLPANLTPPSSQEPSKSILKKRTYEEYLADDLFPPERLQRASTPEPENPPEHPAYLLSPIKTLVQSVAPGTFEDVPEADLLGLIEAYCVITARIRAKLLPAAIPGGNKPVSTDTILQPALQPLREYASQIATSISRDILRALEDPLQSCGKPVPQAPLSPPPSSPSPFDSSPVASETQESSSTTSGKKGGMNEQQVKHARDLCTVSQSAMKLLSCLLSFIGLVREGLLFTESELSDLLGAVITLPLSSPLPTPNSRKTCALAVNVLSSSNFTPTALATHADQIAAVFKRSIDGELGREGKKGSAADALRGVLLLSMEKPLLFATPFGVLLPSVVKILQGPVCGMQTQAGFAIAGLAWSSTEAHITPADTACLKECLSLRTVKKKENSGELQLPQILLVITKFFQNLIKTTAAKDSGESNGSSPPAAIQTAAHTSAMWGLTVLSSLIVLAGRVVHDDAVITGTVTKIIRLLLVSKRVAVRTAASWAWRAYVWSILRHFEDLDMDAHQKRAELIRRVFDFLDKGVGVGIVCSLLVGSAGREDRDLRIELSLATLAEMAKRRANTAEAIQILDRLLQTESFVEPEGPVPGWELNKLLPLPLFDGQLAESDTKALLVLIKDQSTLEVDWVREVTALRTEECSERLDALYDIWLASIKGHGVDDRGHAMENIIDTWSLLLKQFPSPPSKRVLEFLTQKAHVWTNLADPGDHPTQIMYHQVVQARFVKQLWIGLVDRFGDSTQLRQLAIDIYDQALQVFNTDEPKIEDVCVDLFARLAAVESSIVVLMMGHEEWTMTLKHNVWVHAIDGAEKEDFVRALCLAPFSEPQPFQMNEADWTRWENAWAVYMQSRGEVAEDMLQLQHAFVEELSGTLSLRSSTLNACRVASAILRTLPGDAVEDVDCEDVHVLINESLINAYDSGVTDALHTSITNLHLLTQAMPKLPPATLSSFTPSLIHWITDEEQILNDAEYDLIIGSTYTAALEMAGRLPACKETLVDHCELITSITSRITAEGATLKAFETFWNTHYAGIVNWDDIPPQICTIIMAADQQSSQELSQVDTSPPNQVEADIENKGEPSPVQGDEDNTTTALASPIVDSNDNFHPVDPLAKAAPPSEAPDVGDDDCIPNFRASSGLRWVGSSEDLTEAADTEPQFKVSQSLFDWPASPRDAIPGLGQSPSNETYKLSSTPVFNVQSPTRSAKKRRSGDEEDATPVKRRRQTLDDDSDSEDESTPRKPWFWNEFDNEDQVLPFQPFTKHNLPSQPYQFQGPPGGSTVKPQKQATSVQPVAPTSNKQHDTYIKSGHADAERGYPSSKRRRVADASKSPALNFAPHSDDAVPSSDDAPQAQIPASDETASISGDFDARDIVSPPMVKGEPGSDDSTESPLKALAERKRRQEAARARSEPSVFGSLVTKPKPLMRQTFSQPTLDTEVREAIQKVDSLLTALDDDGLRQISFLLKKTRDKMENELLRRSSQP
ncbi:hypothetical protein FRC17_005196 [Serendipita sp. 399]|nr:hypothetical protein FRC17_005196 [Serendipita sp. 399]